LTYLFLTGIRLNREANEPQFPEWSSRAGRPAAPVKAGDVRLRDRQGDPVQDEGFLSFGEGCIYPLLHHLEQTRSVSSRRKVVERRSRYYYRLTPRGTKRLEELSKEWNQVAAGVSLFMEARHA